MEMTFREKSILGSLVIAVGLFSLYFLKLYEGLTSGSSEYLSSLPAVLLQILGAVVVVEVIYHVIIAALYHRDANAAADERDKLIAARAGQISYYILAVGCGIATAHILLYGFVGSAFRAFPMEPMMVAANLLIFSFILAEVVGFALQLYFYRRGI